MRAIIQLIIRAIKSRVFLDESFMLYEYHQNNIINSTVDLKEADENNLKDVLTFDTKTNYRNMRTMLRDGVKGYLGYVDGICIHRSWYKDTEGEVKIYKFLPFLLKEDEAYIYYCATSKEMRGKSIYPYTISFIAKILNSSKRIFIATSTKNSASMKGIEKAGFKAIELWRIRVICGFKKRSRIIVNYSEE
jgi:hypothetical protein